MNADRGGWASYYGRFTNTTAYKTYRVLITSTAGGAAAGAVQFSLTLPPTADVLPVGTDLIGVVNGLASSGAGLAGVVFGTGAPGAPVATARFLAVDTAAHNMFFTLTYSMV